MSVSTFSTAAVPESERPWHWDYWGLQSEPFHPVLRWPEERHLVYRSRSWEEGMARLLYVAEHQFGLAMVTGAAGTGKTLLLAAAADQLSRLNFHPLLHRCQSTPVEEAGHLPLGKTAHWETRQFLSGEISSPLQSTAGSRYVLLLDDVGRVKKERTALEQLVDRALQQRTLGCLVLVVSQPDALELFDYLSGYAPLVIRCPGYANWETAEYLQHRFVQAGGTLTPFTPEAAQLLHECSGGIPRQLNRLAHESLLLAAFQQAPSVQEEHVAAVQQNYQGFPQPVRSHVA